TRPPWPTWRRAGRPEAGRPAPTTLVRRSPPSSARPRPDRRRGTFTASPPMRRRHWAPSNPAARHDGGFSRRCAPASAGPGPGAGRPGSGGGDGVAGRVRRAGRLYQRGVLGGDAGLRAEADRELDAAEADLAVARGRLVLAAVPAAPQTGTPAMTGPPPLAA